MPLPYNEQKQSHCAEIERPPKTAPMQSAFKAAFPQILQVFVSSFRGFDHICLKSTGGLSSGLGQPTDFVKGILTMPLANAVQRRVSIAVDAP